MQTVTFVIGATATGKTYFINHMNVSAKDVDSLNIYDYQQRAYDEAGFGESVPLFAQFRCLKQAQDRLLEDIIKSLSAGRDVVVEQTFYKAKRRIAYIEKIKETADVAVEVYVMCPGDARWQANLESRKLEGGLEGYKRDRAELEFPNPAEGFHRIYEVADAGIRLRMDEPRPEIIDRAKEELAREAEDIRAQDEARRRRKELIESMAARPFWHYCEVCGRREFLTAKDAFDSGWDYPPRMGHFGLLGPRTCGDCGIDGTLWFKINAPGRFPVVIEKELTPQELATWRRIKAEPESLLAEEPE